MIERKCGGKHIGYPRRGKVAVRRIATRSMMLLYVQVLAAQDGQQTVNARSSDARPEAFRQGGVVVRSCTHGAEHNKKSARRALHPPPSRKRKGNGNGHRSPVRANSEKTRRSQVGRRACNNNRTPRFVRDKYDA